MSTEVKKRRGTYAEHEAFAGGNAEITVETDARTLRVHDGSTPGGVVIGRKLEFDSLTSAVTFLSSLSHTYPDDIEIGTSSFRNRAECDALSIPYPDGGHGKYTSGTGFGTADGVRIIDVGSRQIQLATTRSLNLLQWGGVPDDLTSTISTMQLMFDYLNTQVGGGEIVVPAGVFWFPGGQSISPGFGNITVRGEGRDVSVLHYYEGTTSPATSGDDFLFKDINNVAKGTLTFKDIQIRGTLDDNGPRAGRWANPMWLDYYEEVVIDNCKFIDIASVAMDIHFCEKFTCVNNHFENIAADVVRCRDTPNILVDNNFILRNGDDAIACHTTDLVDVARQNLVVTNNILVNAGSIKNIAGRVMTIANNLQVLPNFAAIWTRVEAGPEGGAQSRDINIHDNMILNAVSIGLSGIPAALAVGITVRGLDAKAGTGTNGVIPTMYDAVSGDFVFPWDYDQSLEQDVADAIIPMAGINIHDNTIRRTLPNAAAFSDYGYGTRLFQGVGYDPAMPDTAFRLNTGIVLEGSLNNSKVHHNTIEHCETAFSLDGLTESDGLVYGIEVSDNTMSDVTVRGFLMQGTTHHDVTLRNNEFDLDRYRKGTNSNIDGTYSVAGTPTAVDLGSSLGVKLIGNKFKNCNTVLQTNVTADVYKSENIISCDPVATGFSTSNVGVGTVLHAGSGFRYEIVNSDPTDADYLQFKSTQLVDYQFDPTSLGHKWVEGAFVESSKPNVDVNGVRLGWKRLTTGVGDVIDTDWSIVRVIGSAS